MSEQNWTTDPDHIGNQEPDPSAGADTSQPVPQGDNWQQAPQQNDWQQAPQQNPQQNNWQQAPQQDGWQNQQPNDWQGYPQQPGSGYGQIPPDSSWNGRPHAGFGQQSPNPYSPENGQTSSGSIYSQKKPADRKTTGAIALGVFSLLVSCCCFPLGVCVGFAAAMAGLALIIISRTENQNQLSGYGAAGLALCVIGLLESLFIFGCYAYVVSDPQLSAILNGMLRSLGYGY